jgi:hypothetical protein
VGFWDEIKDLGKQLGKAAVQGFAANGHVQQLIEDLKNSPRSSWPRIIEAGYRQVMGSPESINPEVWSKMLSQELTELENNDPHFDGVITAHLTVLAKLGIEYWVNKDH